MSKAPGAEDPAASGRRSGSVDAHDRLLSLAVARAWSGRSEFASGGATMPDWLRDHYDLLAALAAPTDRAFLAASDALAERYALTEEARDTLRFAREEIVGVEALRLRREAKFNRVARLFNTLFGAAGRLLQGDFTVISRTALSLWRGLGFGELTPRERKELFLLRRHRWALSAEEKLRGLEPQLGRELDARRLKLLRQDRRDRIALLAALFEESLFDRRYEEAASYAELLPRKERERFIARLEKDRGEWRRRAALGLRISPTIEDELPPLERAALASLAAGRGDSLRALATALPTNSRPIAKDRFDRTFTVYLIALAAGLESKPRTEAAWLSRLGAFGGPPEWRALFEFIRHEPGLYPEAAAERAEQDYRAAVRAFILGGKRSASDRLYVSLYGAVGGPIGAANTGIFFGLEALFRWIGSFVVKPLPPENFADAAWRAAGSPRLNREERAEWLRRAEDAWSAAGRPDRALRLARESPPILGLPPTTPERLAELESELAKLLLRRTSSAESPAAKREFLEAIVRHYPKTPSAAEARARLRKLPTTTRFSDDLRTLIVAGDDLLPSGLFADLRPLLALKPDFTDGKTQNGEIARLVIRREPTAAVEAVLRDGRRFKLPPETQLIDRFFETFTIEHHGRRVAKGMEDLFPSRLFPFGVEGGIGGGGIDFQPRLKEYKLRANDARLFAR